MTEIALQWYILQQPDGHCAIQAFRPEPDGYPAAPHLPDASLKRWGPYASQADAFAKRIGLIRAGYCRPY